MLWKRCLYLYCFRRFAFQWSFSLEWILLLTFSFLATFIGLFSNYSFSFIFFDKLLCSRNSPLFFHLCYLPLLLFCLLLLLLLLDFFFFLLFFQFQLLLCSFFLFFFASAVDEIIFLLLFLCNVFLRGKASKFFFFWIFSFLFSFLIHLSPPIKNPLMRHLWCFKIFILCFSRVFNVTNEFEKSMLVAIYIYLKVSCKLFI